MRSIKQLSLALAGGAFALPAGQTQQVCTYNSTDYHQNAGVLNYVSPLIGTYGTDPNNNGGMIPSVSPPFGMTRWTPQTRENFISQVPYGYGDSRIHGFQATHQPAIWMGEAGQVVLTPGIGAVQSLFVNRGLAFQKGDERSSPYVYETILDATQLMNRDYNDTAAAVNDGPVPGGAQPVPLSVEEGANGRTRKRQVQSESSTTQTTSPYEKSIQVAMSADSHVGYLRFDFIQCNQTGSTKNQPWVHVEVSRQNWTGNVQIDPQTREVSGYNTERQDYLLGPDHASGFKGFFVSRFSEPFAEFGVTNGGSISKNLNSRTGNFTGAYVKFNPDVSRVEVRTGVSYVSVDQARRNLDIEAPDSATFEDTVENTKQAWLEKLGRVTIEGVNATDAAHDPRKIWYTGLFHALQYPSDYSEPTSNATGAARVFYSGYTDSTHTDTDSYYQSWSIWDTYRAEHTMLTLFAPERVNSMMRTLLRIFDWSGRLPMWANMVETNIMIATNADVVLANALQRGFKSFDVPTAWNAVKKDAYTPPENDTELLYYDREPRTPFEARAGLTSYMAHGWVANDGWSESASRTLDYSFNDYACAVVASHAGMDANTISALQARSKNYATIWNNSTKFMQARNGNGTWANPTWGWTEGDDWVYTFDVMHDVKGLSELFGGRDAMRQKLDEFFTGGHDEQSNEPSHHVPYLYSALGYPAQAAEWVRQVAWDNYNATAGGLSGNEDLGQMSSWYLFSALGFYPVNPASDEYIVASPFFEKVSIDLPPGAATGGVVTGQAGKTLVISAPGAPSKPYVKSLKVDGKPVDRAVLTHSDLVTASNIDFEMSDTPTNWGTQPTW